MIHWPDFLPEIIAGVLLFRLWVTHKRPNAFNIKQPYIVKVIINRIKAWPRLQWNKSQFWLSALGYTFIANLIAVLWASIAIKSQDLRSAGFQDVGTPFWEIMAELFTETYTKGGSFWALTCTNIVADILGLLLAQKIWHYFSQKKKKPLSIASMLLIALLILPIMLLTVTHFFASSGISQTIISGRSATVLMWQDIFQQSLMLTAVLPILLVLSSHIYHKLGPIYKAWFTPPNTEQKSAITLAWIGMRVTTLYIILIGLIYQPVGPWIEDRIARLGFSFWLLFS